MPDSEVKRNKSNKMYRKKPHPSCSQRFGIFEVVPVFLLGISTFEILGI